MSRLPMNICTLQFVCDKAVTSRECHSLYSDVSCKGTNEMAEDNPYDEPLDRCHDISDPGLDRPRDPGRKSLG